MSTWRSCCTKMFCLVAAQKIRYMETEAAIDRYEANGFTSKQNYLKNEKNFQMN